MRLDGIFKSRETSEATDSTFTFRDLTLRAASFYYQARVPRDQWKDLNNLIAPLSEFDLLCAVEQYDNACRVLNDIDFGYMFLWGHYRLLIKLRQRIKDKIHEKKLIMYNLNSLGNSLNAIGASEKSIGYYEEGLKTAQESKNRIMEGILLTGIAFAYTCLDKIPEAIDLYEQALAIHREVGNKSSECLALANLGS